MARILARLIFGHDSISRGLEKSALVQSLARRFHARAFINAALARHPIQRIAIRSGVKYQIETFEALSVEQMYFGNPSYTEIFASKPPRTFLDLGCNSGLFPCFLSHLALGRPLSGLCVDANAEQVALARKSAHLNSWKDIHYRHGLVGCQTGHAEESEFFLHPTSLGSSQFAYTNSESGWPNEWRRVVVPTLNVADAWTKLFGPASRCNCLKIDIEGSEMMFLRSEALFLDRVDTILVEWHSFSASDDVLVKFLNEHGFAIDRELEKTPFHGVIFFRRHLNSESNDVI